MSEPVFLARAKRRSFPRSLRVAFLAAAARVLAGGLLAGCVGGCATGGGYSYLATIAGGERLPIPLVKGVPEMTKKDDIQILRASGAANAELKKLGYFFAFSDKSTEPLRSVIVEDVSDQAAVVLLEDLEPKVVEKRWAGVSRLLSPQDPAAKWIFYADDTFRVFRFTITRANGKKIVIHQGSRVPGWAKVGIRTALGEKP